MKKATADVGLQTSLNNRVDQVRRALTEFQLDGFLLTDSTNIRYVMGFTGSAAYALITDSQAILITDARYTLRAAAECPHATVQIASGSGGYSEALANVSATLPQLKRIGYESAIVTVAQWEKLKRHLPNAKLVSTEDIVENLRATKDIGEIERIRKAIEVAEAAFISVQNVLKAGITERDFAIELEFAMRRAGAEASAFETIVASGENGARPHHTPGERRLKEGDLVTIDWGALVDGYNSDITRTVHIGGVPPTPQQREVYDIVLEAQQRAIRAVAPGKNGQEIDAVARDYIALHGYGDAFGHSLGHSLGLKVHDGPGLSARSANVILKPGMVLTVEPGIYLADWGGVRIEEDILVTESGCEILTHLPNSFTTSPIEIP